VICAVGAVLRELECLRSRINPGAEFLSLMNVVRGCSPKIYSSLNRGQVTDMQTTLISVRDCIEALENSKAPAARQSYQDLPDAVDQVQSL